MFNNLPEINYYEILNKNLDKIYPTNLGTGSPYTNPAFPRIFVVNLDLD